MQFSSNGFFYDVPTFEDLENSRRQEEKKALSVVYSFLTLPQLTDEEVVEFFNGCDYHILNEDFNQPKFLESEEAKKFLQQIKRVTQKYLQESAVGCWTGVTMLDSSKDKFSTVAKMMNVRMFNEVLELDPVAANQKRIEYWERGYIEKIFDKFISDSMVETYTGSMGETRARSTGYSFDDLLKGLVPNYKTHCRSFDEFWEELVARGLFREIQEVALSQLKGQ